MIKTFVALLIVCFSINESFARISQNSRCEIETAVRCLCEASMMVSCSGNAGTIKGKGYVKNDENVRYAFLKVRDTKSGEVREISLSDDLMLKGMSARSFYGINSNNDFRNKANIKDREEISVEYIELDPSLKLYADTKGKEEINQNKSSASNDACSFVDDTPQIANYSGSCGGKKICLARIKCASQEVGLAACPVNIDGNCPSATECAADELINLEANRSNEPIAKSNSSSSTFIGK